MLKMRYQKLQLRMWVIWPLFQSLCSPTNNENVGQNFAQMFSCTVYSPGQCVQTGNGVETVVKGDVTPFQQDAAETNGSQWKLIQHVKQTQLWQSPSLSHQLKWRGTHRKMFVSNHSRPEEGFVFTQSLISLWLYLKHDVSSPCQPVPFCKILHYGYLGYFL